MRFCSAHTANTVASPEFGSRSWCLQVPQARLSSSDASMNWKKPYRLRGPIAARSCRSMPTPTIAVARAASRCIACRRSRDEVILPEQTLRLLDRNVLTFVNTRDQLRRLGQSTRKGILLYGPPGTGKTHTIRYLATHLPGHTTLIITAEQIGLLGGLYEPGTPAPAVDGGDRGCRSHRPRPR